MHKKDIKYTFEPKYCIFLEKCWNMSWDSNFLPRVNLHLMLAGLKIDWMCWKGTQNWTQTGVTDAPHSREAMRCDLQTNTWFGQNDLFTLWPFWLTLRTHIETATYRPVDKNSRAWRRGIRLKWRCHPSSSQPSPFSLSGVSVCVCVLTSPMLPTGG